MVSLVWGLLLCGAPCGCRTTSRSMPFLLSGVVLASLICLPVWGLGTAAFLLGVHGQSLLCQPLHDQPHYKALAEILDSGGILHKEGGVFKAFLKANDSLKTEDVLKSCQLNQPAYPSFHLHNFFDANSATNYNNWQDLQTTVGNFTISDAVLEILSPSLQLNLQFLASLSLDLASCRSKISGSLTRKDLSSFADQLDAVARQLSDPASGRRIDELASTLRKIIHGEMAHLNDLKDRILFKITALDLLIHPLSLQANRSLAHFKDAQIFLNGRGKEVAGRISAQYISRLESYLEDLHTHVTAKLTKEIGNCKPLYDIFRLARFFTCKLIVDPTNGISVSSFILTLLFLGVVIVVLNLVEHYRELNEELLTSITHRRARNGLVIDDEGTWASPTLETPPDVEMREPATWASPNARQGAEPLIPPPPRLRRRRDRDLQRGRKAE